MTSKDNETPRQAVPTQHRDSVAITGSVIGLASLFLGWLTFRPNRLVGGTGLYLWQSFAWFEAVLIILWLVCFFFSTRPKSSSAARVTGITANAILALTFLLAGAAAARLTAADPLTRVSLSAGIWATAAGAYVVIFAARRALRGSRLWQNVITWSGLLVIAVLLVSGWGNHLSLLQEFAGHSDRFWTELLHHISIFTGSVAIGILLGIPLGIWAARSKRAEKPVFFIAGITQTIPSLALFGLLIAPLSALSFAFPVLRQWGINGIGNTPAVIALVIYSLLPMVQNTFTGIRQVDPAAIDAGKGMGMDRLQILWRVQAPLAAPIVLEGVRTAAVQAVGNTAVAALIGAGGLGWFIFQGLGQGAADLILLGALPIIVLALLVDGLMRGAIKLASPKGLHGGAT